MKIILKDAAGNDFVEEAAIEAVESNTDQVGVQNHREEVFAKQVQNPNTFYVSKQLLQTWSRYFGALSNFQEGQENTVTLNGIRPRAFREIIHWIYRGYLAISIESESWEELLELYVAVDFLVMPALANALVDEARHHARNIGEITLAMLYQLRAAGVYENSGLAQFVMDYIAYQAAETGFANIRMEGHARDFFQEGGTMVAALMEKITSAMSECDSIRHDSWNNPNLKSPAFKADHPYHEPESTSANDSTNTR